LATRTASPGLPAVVARDHLELLAEDTALRIDLLDRELPAPLVRLQECGLRLIAVELADLHRVLRDGGRAETDGARGGEPKEPEFAAHAVLHLMGFCNSRGLAPVDK